MNKILNAAVTALVVASSGAAYAGSEQEVTGPSRMTEMTARSYVRPLDESGKYRVEIYPLVAGRWAVSLVAQTPDEAE